MGPWSATRKPLDTAGMLILGAEGATRMTFTGRSYISKSCDLLAWVEGALFSFALGILILCQDALDQGLCSSS